jgi:hypothetical protein
MSSPVGGGEGGEGGRALQAWAICRLGCPTPRALGRYCSRAASGRPRAAVRLPKTPFKAASREGPRTRLSAPRGLRRRRRCPLAAPLRPCAPGLAVWGRHPWMVSRWGLERRVQGKPHAPCRGAACPVLRRPAARTRHACAALKDFPVACHWFCCRAPRPRRGRDSAGSDLPAPRLPRNHGSVAHFCPRRCCSIFSEA